MNRFRKQGYLQYSRTSIQIDRDALRAAIVDLGLPAAARSYKQMRDESAATLWYGDNHLAR